MKLKSLLFVATCAGLPSGTFAQEGTSDFSDLCTSKNTGSINQECIDTLNRLTEPALDISRQIKKNGYFFTGQINDEGCLEVMIPGAGIINHPLFRQAIDPDAPELTEEEYFNSFYKWICPETDDREPTPMS